MDYLGKVAWTTIIQDMIMLDDFTYSVIVVPININDSAAHTAEKQIGYCLRSFLGNTYRIIEINVDDNPNKILISDDFEIGYGPELGQISIVYKTTGDGRAPYLGSINSHGKLDDSAIDVIKSTELEILWAKINQTNVKWHPEGILFSCEVIPEKDRPLINDPLNPFLDLTLLDKVKFSNGTIVIHDWVLLKETIIPRIPKLLPVDIYNSTLENPIFILGESSTRKQKRSHKTYTATAVNSKKLIYSLDVLSLLSGNSIDADNGDVLYVDDWFGITTITVTAQGGIFDVPTQKWLETTTSATHIITVEKLLENEIGYEFSSSLEPDNTRIDRRLNVFADDYVLEDNSLYYLYALVPIDDEKTDAKIIISKNYYRENIYGENINILMGVLNSYENERNFSMLWGNIGKLKPLYRGSFSIGSSFEDRCLDIPLNIEFGIAQYIETPLKAGSNRIFFSIPADKKIIVLNSMGANVSSKYKQIIPEITDNLEKYQPNIFYKGSNVFMTTDRTYNFTIKIY